ncbi:hypothetical protein KO317_03770 [Candidatus Micrarchaeota archaeon]|nr:hypothetical protein [Candidatus Micrarchaeota archaeon]
MIKIKYVFILIVFLSFFVFADDDLDQFIDSINPINTFDSSFISANPSLSTGNLFLSEKITDVSDNIGLAQDISLMYSTNKFEPEYTDFSSYSSPLYYANPNELGIGWDMNFPYIQARPNTFVGESKDFYLYKLFINGRNYDLVVSNWTTDYKEYKTKEYSNLKITKYKITDITSYWIILDTQGTEYTFNHSIISLLPSANESFPNEWCYQEGEEGKVRCNGGEADYITIDWDGHSAFNYWNAYDSNWSTYAQGTDGATLYINYTKPGNALPSSLWKVKNAGGFGSARTQNLSIPEQCWSYTDTLQFRARIQNNYTILVPAWNETEEVPVLSIDGRIIGYETVVIEHEADWGYNTSLNWECYALDDLGVSTGYWYTILSVPDVQDIYEEAMWWHLNITEPEPVEEIDFDFEVGFPETIEGSDSEIRVLSTTDMPRLPDPCGLHELADCPSTNGGNYYYYYINYTSRWDITKIKDKDNNELNFEYDDEIKTKEYTICLAWSIGNCFIDKYVPHNIKTRCVECRRGQYDGYNNRINLETDFCNKYYNRQEGEKELESKVLNSDCVSEGCNTLTNCANFDDDYLKCILRWAVINASCDLDQSVAYSCGGCVVKDTHHINYTQSSKISKITDSYGHEIEFNYDTLNYDSGFCFRGFDRYNRNNCYRLNSIKKYLTKDGDKTLIENNILTYNILDITEDGLGVELLIDGKIKQRLADSGGYELNKQ